MDLRDEFLNIISSKSALESDAQEFIEKNPNFLFLPFLLNHGLHLDVIITKFVLNGIFIPDFAYLTKSSISWNFVLVEIESPNKKLFNYKNGKFSKTSEFNKAIEQINSWKIYVKSNGDKVADIIRPLQGIMQDNPINFKYYLIIGRKMEEVPRGFAENMDILTTDDVHVCTYDSLLSYYNVTQSDVNCNIIRHKGKKYEFKYLHSCPFGLFSVLGQDDFYLDEKYDELLKGNGFDIEEWRKGKKLLVNGKSSIESHKFVKFPKRRVIDS